MIVASLFAYLLVTPASFSPEQDKFLQAVQAAESKSTYRESREEEMRRTLERIKALNANPRRKSVVQVRRYPPLPPRRPRDLPSRKP